MIHELSESKVFLKIESTRIILEKGGKRTWDSFGVRDPAILVDENGYIYKHKGKILLYYTGSSNGLDQKIGLAISEDGVKGKRFQKQL